MKTISKTISRSAQSAGCKVRCGADVMRKSIDDGHVCGAKVTDEKTIRVSIAISNDDLKRIFLDLVGRENIAPAVATSIEKLETTHATLKIHAAASELPDLSRHLESNFDSTLIATIGIGPTTAYCRKPIQDALDGEITTCPAIDAKVVLTEWLNKGED